MEYTFKYEATITCNETDEIVAVVSAGSEEGMEEEMGKKKFSGAVERYLMEKLP